MPTGEAVNLELRAALFEQGHDISDPDVLSAIATRHGLRSPDNADRHRALEDWHDGQARGVVGSPHFFLATGDYFCPTLKVSRDNGQLRITTDEESIATFIDTAHAPDRCPMRYSEPSPFAALPRTTNDPSGPVTLFGLAVLATLAPPPEQGGLPRTSSRPG